MKWKSVIISILSVISISLGTQVKDDLHGFSADIPDDYIIHASSKTGKITVMHYSYTHGISFFLLKNSKSKDKTYLLKALTLLLKNSGNIYYKSEKNKITAVIKAPYLGFNPFFDTFFAQEIFLRGLAHNPGELLITVIQGKKYSLAVVMLYSNSKELKRLKNIASSFKFFKPKIRYKNKPVLSQLLGIPAFYVDLPSDFSVKNSFYISRTGEIPALLFKSKTEGVFNGFVLYQYLYSADPIMPMAVSTILDFRTGQEIPLQMIFNTNEEFMNFVLNYITGRANFKFELIDSYLNILNPTAVDYFYAVKSKNFYGKITVTKSEVVMGYTSKTASLLGYFNIAWGKNLGKAIGVLNSIEANPKWVSETLKVSIEEAKKEIEHQRWMWNEFRKTQDYIEKLRKREITEEQVFQEEMARALTNILSDYTYARDPETGEIFHLKDDFDQYWRTKEGEIIGISGEIDEKALEAEGFKKLQIRLEGFGQW